jgi:DNA-binding LytR/AlgR family response regulator
MPGLSGLEVAAAAALASPATLIVFVTAYNQYAVDAFERGAVDYLLKPVTAERLAATAKRLKARGRVPDPASVAAVIEQLRATLPAAAGALALMWITASVGRRPGYRGRRRRFSRRTTSTP